MRGVTENWVYYERTEMLQGIEPEGWEFTSVS